MTIKDKQTGDILGRITTNRSLTFAEAMELAGYEYTEGNDTGWTRDGITFYDENTVELCADD